MVKKIICVMTVLLITVSGFALTGCRPMTEAEIIKKVNKTVRRFYIEGTGKHLGYKEFETEVIYAFDGTPEYALVEFDTTEYAVFIIVNNTPYFINSIQYRSNGYINYRNPYKEANIEKGNRYFSVTSQKEMSDNGKVEYYIWHAQYAFMDNGVLTNIFTDETYSKEQIKSMSKYSRKNYKRHSTRLKNFIFPA